MEPRLYAESFENVQQTASELWWLSEG